MSSPESYERKKDIEMATENVCVMPDGVQRPMGGLEDYGSQGSCAFQGGEVVGKPSPSVGMRCSFSVAPPLPVESAVSTVAIALVSLCLLLRLRRSMRRSQRGGAHGLLTDAGQDLPG